MVKVKLIKVRAKILKDMFVSEYNYEKAGTFVDPKGKFTGWYIEANYETGEYDSGKSSMVDFDVHLYKPCGESKNDFEYVGKAKGGYYYRGNYSFSSDLYFYPETIESKKFRDFLSRLIDVEDLSLKQVIKRIEKEIKKIKG